MKKFLILVYLLVLSSVAVFAEQADVDPNDNKTNPDELVEVVDKALKVDIVTLGQEYPSKQTAFQITIQSEVDSGRATIQWYWPSNLYRIVGETKSSIMLMSGNNYVATKYFDPIIYEGENAGVRSFTIGVKVTALVYEQNYQTVYKKTFLIDQDMQILPISDAYKEAKTKYVVSDLVLKVGGASIIMIIVSFVLKKFINYVNSPDKDK